MAVDKSGTISLGTSGTLLGQIYWEETVDKDNNKSTLVVKAQVKKSNATTEPTTGTWSFKIEIGDSSHVMSSSWYGSVGQSWVTIGTYTRELQHGDDGSLSVYLYAKCSAPSGTSMSGYAVSGSDTVTLTPIARASTITSAATISLGSSVSIKWTPADKSYKFRVYFTFGTDSKNYKYNSGWKPGSNVYIEPNSTAEQTYTDFTIPLTVAEYITSATYGTMTAHLSTHKADGTQIGSTQTKDFRVNIPASVKPSVSMALSDQMGYLAKYGGYVQSKSKLTVALTKTLAYGSPIKSYSIKVGTALSYTTDGVTTDVLPESGSVTVTATVTDARGRVGTASSTITVLPYSPPQITAIDVIRCNQNGAPDPAGAYGLASFTGIITALNNHNSAIYKLKYKVSGADLWTEYEMQSFAGDFTPDKAAIIFTATPAGIFEVCVEASDDFSAVPSVVATLPVGYAYFRTNAELDGFTFGRENVKHNMFGCAWDAEFDGDVTVEGDLTLGGHDSPVGTVLYNETVGEVEVSTSGTGNITSLGIPAGVWVIIGGFWTGKFSGASVGGSLRITLGGTNAMNDKNPAGNMEGYGSNTYRMTGSTEFLEGEVVTIRNLETDGTVYLNAYHTAKTAITFKGSIRAVRIK